MRKENIYDFVTIGGSITWYKYANTGYKVKGEGGLISSIERFLSILEDLKLHVTKRAAEDLLDFKNNLKRKKIEKLSQRDCDKLRDLTKILFPTFKAEIRGCEVYLINDKRYTIEKLTYEIDKLFTPSLFNSLSDIAQYDIQQCGKCILHETPTAAAFHILRSTETILRGYYKKFLRRKPENKTWGQMLSDLRNKTRGKIPNNVTLNHLKNIKDSYRNPTQHPDKIYDIDEVQDLFNLCIDVINKMIEEIK